MLSACQYHDPVKQKLVRDLRNLAEIEDFEDMTVSIYWIESYVLIDILGQNDELNVQTTSSFFREMRLKESWNGSKTSAKRH